MSNNIFLVVRESGLYDDYRLKPVKCFADGARAQTWADGMSDMSERIHCEWEEMRERQLDEWDTRLTGIQWPDPEYDRIGGEILDEYNTLEKDLRKKYYSDPDGDEDLLNDYYGEQATYSVWDMGELR